MAKRNTLIVPGFPQTAAVGLAKSGKPRASEASYEPQ
jgi:hypothetical protein